MQQIDVLPDDVLLEIFDFYGTTMCLLYHDRIPDMAIGSWQVLVHVCRRWRNLVFESPLRLNLRLLCNSQKRVKERLNIWPALPLVVSDSWPVSSNPDNFVAALAQTNRVCQVNLNLEGWRSAEVLAAMKVPFPELTDLRLFSSHSLAYISDSFLGGSAPSLRHISLDRNIVYPELPKLLLSTNHLVSLSLANISHPQYISLVAIISVLYSLEALSLRIRYHSLPDWADRSPPPPKRSILPALKSLHFNGPTENLEVLVTVIDTPQLDKMYITTFSFNQINFGCPLLAHFINRTPTLRAFNKARVYFDTSSASVELVRFSASRTGLKNLSIDIYVGEPDQQLPSIERVRNSSLHPLSTVEDLYIEHQYWKLVWENDAIEKLNENALWLQLLLPFTAVKNLYLSKVFVPGIAAALQELFESKTEVLPSLQNIFLEGLEPSGPVATNIERAVATRQISGRPIAIFDWHKDSDSEEI